MDEHPVRIVEASSASEPTPHNRALYEAGKQMLTESISTGREFCKFMITTSASALPIYIALLKLVEPHSAAAAQTASLLVISPCALLILSTVLFAYGYFPTRHLASLDLPAEIETARRNLIGRRKRWAAAGFSVFVVAQVLAVVVISSALYK